MPGLDPIMPTQAIPIYKRSLGTLRVNNVSSFASTVRNLCLLIIEGIIFGIECIMEILDITIRMKHIPWFDAGGSFARLED